MPAATRPGDIYANLVLLLLLLPNLNVLFFLGFSFYNQPVLPLALIGVTTLARVTLGARFTIDFPVLFTGAVALLLVAYLPTLSGESQLLRGLTAVGYLAGPIVLAFISTQAGRFASLPLLLWLILQTSTCAGQFAEIYKFLGPLTDTLKAIFVGFSTETIGGGRGCSGTYAEPSHLARYAFATLGIVMVLGWQSHGKPYRPLGAAIMCALLVVATLSITGLALLVATAAFAGAFAYIKRATPLQRVVLGVAGSGSIAALTLVMLVANMNFNIQQTGPSIRMFDLVRQVSAVAENLQNVDFYDLQRFGGHRLIHTYIGYASISQHPFGQGIASYAETFQATAEQVDVDLNKIDSWRTGRIQSGGRVVVKPNAYGAQLAYDFGIFGVLAALGLAAYALARAVAGMVTTAQAAVALAGLLQILFYSTTTIIGPWILLGLLGLNLRPNAPADRGGGESRPATPHSARI